MKFFGAYKVVKSEDDDQLRWEGGCYGDKDKETLGPGEILGISGSIEGMAVLIEVPDE